MLKGAKGCRGAVFVLDHAFFVVQFHKQYVVDFGTFSVFFAGGFFTIQIIPHMFSYIHLFSCCTLPLH